MLRRCIARVVAAMGILPTSILLFITFIVKGIKEGYLWTSITHGPLVLMAYWKSMFTFLITLDSDLAMRCYFNEVEDL